jgi:hypothetical protein
MSETAAPVVQAPIPPKPNGTAPKVEAPVVDPKAPKVEAKPDPLAEREKIVAQKDAASAKRFREAAEAQKKADAILKDFEADPVAALQKYKGADARAIIKKYTEMEEAYAKLTPEQQENERLKRELADRDVKLKQTEAEKKAAREAEEVRIAEVRLERDLLAAAQRNNADATPDMLAMMADVGLELAEFDITPDTPGWADHVVREAQARIDGNVTQFGQKVIQKAIKAGDVGKLRGIIGDEGVNLILKDSVTKMPSAGQPRTQAQPEVKRDTKGHVSPAEFDAKFGFSARRK